MDAPKDKLIEKPGFFAVIPADVRYDKTLSPNAKLLYGEISALLTFNNKCFASNEYFARLYDVSEVQVSRLIKQLADSGHIITELEKTNNGTRRIINLALNKNVNTPLNKNDKRALNKNVNHKEYSNKDISLFNNNDNGEFFPFDEFWDLYGKKVGLKKCKGLWAKINLNARKKIKESLAAWKNQFSEIQFMPYPETYLSEERWNDEIIVSAKKDTQEHKGLQIAV